jgi:hypothetical protein
MTSVHCSGFMRIMRLSRVMPAHSTAQPHSGSGAVVGRSLSLHAHRAAGQPCSKVGSLVREDVSVVSAPSPGAEEGDVWFHHSTHDSAPRTRTSIVDQHVDAAPLVADGSKHLVEFVALGYVAGDGERVAAGGLDLGRHLLGLVRAGCIVDCHLYPPGGISAVSTQGAARGAGTPSAHARSCWRFAPGSPPCLEPVQWHVQYHAIHR